MMKTVFCSLLLSFLFSCTSTDVIQGKVSKSINAIRSVYAYFKTCEQIDSENFLLVFRRMDNFRYILFKIKKNELANLNIAFLLQSSDAFRINSEIVDRPFNISYTEVQNTDKNLNKIISIDEFSKSKYSSI